jgi:hypothetical protein
LISTSIDSTGSPSLGTAGTAFIHVNGSCGSGNEKESCPWMTAEDMGCPAIRTRAYMSASSGPGSPSPCSRMLMTRRTTMRVVRWRSWLDGTGPRAPVAFGSAMRLMRPSKRLRYSVRPRTCLPWK